MTSPAPRRSSTLVALLAAGALAAPATTAGAQDPAAALAPPPAAGAPGAHYGNPPPGYESMAPESGVGLGTASYGRPPRVRYVERSTNLKALWIPGLVLFPVSYVLTVGVSTSTLGATHDFQTFAFIPLVGPFLMLGEADTGDQEIAAVLGGLAQATGVALFVLGLTIRQTVRVARLERDGVRASLGVRPHGLTGALVELRVER